MKKETKVKTLVIVTIQGKEFTLTKTEAEELLNQLKSEVEKQIIFQPAPEPAFKRYPIRDPFPSWVIPMKYEIEGPTCESFSGRFLVGGGT